MAQKIKHRVFDLLRCGLNGYYSDTYSTVTVCWAESVKLPVVS